MITDREYEFIARDGTPLIFSRTSAPMPAPLSIAAQNRRRIHELGVTVRNARFTNEYNCHGLTFVARLGWFDDVPSILNCHGYQKIGECANFEIDSISTTSDISPGDVVVYYNGDPSKPTHTGIVWESNIRKERLWVTVLSKWGNTSEYFHRHDKVPVIDYGKSLEIWTDRTI